MATAIFKNRFAVVWAIIVCLAFYALYSQVDGPGSGDTSLQEKLKSGATTKEKPKPNAVIIMLVEPSRIYQALRAIRTIEDRFNRRLQYPYVLFTDGEIPQDIQNKLNWLTEGRGRFADLPSEMWDPPSFLDQKLIDHSLNTIGFRMGYRSMCRFFSGFFWKHPAVAHYDYIWRMDSDIVNHCDVPYDPVERMRDRGAVYGFIQINEDAVFVQPSLASNVSQFLSKHRAMVPPGANMKFQWKEPEKALAGNGKSEDWTRLQFYNNWEISHRSVWESNLYTAYFDHLEKAGGFFYERWGDAPVHSYYAAMAFRPEQVMQFTDIGYQHDNMGYECPLLDRCTCDRDNDEKSRDFHNRGDEWYNAKSRTSWPY
ncbi:glycosyltransferase family 15 protein [Sphaerobolus stellatus SS14]|nr:glycosyltransferase family 15 protein [Sphaerobolus stellatus SS14]